jgi:phospholipase C
MALPDIDHIVVLMLENRSFDCMLGTLYPASKDFNGLAGTEYNLNNTGAPVPTWEETGTDATSMSIPDPDPGEMFTDINTQLFGTPNVPNGALNPGMSGFVKNYQAQGATGYDPKAVMHHFTAAQLPVITTLAKQFGVSDSWHASAPCQTWPNRFFVHTGTAGGYENNSPVHFPYTMKTVYDLLDEAEQPWKIYFHDMPQSLTLSNLWLKADHFHFYAQFQADAKAGALPAYSFIEPRYFADAGMPSDQHPPHDATLGEQLIADVYNVLRAGPAWEKTLLIITYDEHGGCFDHQPPPPATPPGPTPSTPFDFDRYGVRVPAVLVSPYIPAGSIIRPEQKLPFDHTSIIATLRERFNLSGPLTNRDAVAPSLGPALTLAAPTNLGPETLDALPYVASPADLADARAMPLNGHQAALLELAAHLPATVAAADFAPFITSYIGHLAAGAVGTDTSAIQDVAGAIAFIKTRLGGFFQSA